MPGMDTSFVEELASAAPTPGGGGASAYCGALASALASMVGNLTVGKKTYVAVEPEVRAALDRLAALRVRLIELVDEDARAFEPLAAVYRMPKDTPEAVAARETALQDALGGACEAPLAIMRAVAEVAELAAFMAEKGSKLARSDAGVAAAFARAASDGASLNIYINAASMADPERAARYRRETDELAAAVRTRCDAVFDQVKQAIS